MTNMYQNQSGQTTDREQLIAHCGLYCKYCPSFTSGKCDGCRGNSAKSAVVYKQCQVKPCCAENKFYTCGDCTTFTSTKDCKKYNPLILRFASWLESSDRSKALAMIKEQGRAAFAAYMEEKNWVIFKTKDTFLNKKYGKRLNEKY